MPTPSDSIAILYWVQEVSDAVDEQLGPVAADAALTLPQFHLLYYVVERGPMRLGELAKRQRCVKSNVSNLVRTMAEKDLVAVRQPPDDGRARVVEATRLGKSRYRKVRRAAEQIEASIHKALGPRAAHELAKLSKRAAEAVDENL